MSFTPFRHATAVAAIVGVAVFAGCNGSQDAPATNPSPPAADDSGNGALPSETADPHDIPLTEAEIAKLKEDTATYAAALEHIKKFRNTIRDETKAGTPAKAHRSLDNVDYVLQWLPEVAQNSNVPKTQWQTVGENAQKLRDLFGQVHTNIDAGNPPHYELVEADVDAAVAALESAGA